MLFGSNLKITMSKIELLAILNKNLARHTQIYNEALEAHKKETIKHLLRLLKDVRAGKEAPHEIFAGRPYSRRDDYTSAIKMLEMSQTDTVELSAHDFACFVEDKWEWRRDFLIENCAYSATARTLSEKED